MERYLKFHLEEIMTTNQKKKKKKKNDQFTNFSQKTGISFTCGENLKETTSTAPQADEWSQFKDRVLLTTSHNVQDEVSRDTRT